ncbi:MAG: type VI secretion system protein TssA [Sedimentisphaerales bacterium]|nr:type VI secretion system protein TssA [Sedimentisphaerales bacterium]
MAKIDIQNLLTEVSAESPCGEDLSYDQSYLALERMVQKKPTGSVLGKEEVAEEPNWREVSEKSFELLKRSKDLRIAIYLTLALLKLDGIPGLRDGLLLLRELLERFWDKLYPQLDVDDDYDPLERINILQSLSPATVSVQDPMKFRQRLLEVPLCNSPKMGKFGLRDIQIAKGEITVSGDQQANAPKMSVIDAAFQDTPAEHLQAASQATEEAIGHVTAIEKVFSERASKGQSPNFSGLQTLLGNIHKYVQGHLAKGAAGMNTEQGGAVDAGEGGAKMSLAGEIGSPKEAILAMEKICNYFERQEPSSPVPLLLRRAQRLVSRTFVEVIEDFCPDAMNQVEAIGGIKKTDSDTGQPV